MKKTSAILPLINSTAGSIIPTRHCSKESRRSPGGASLPPSTSTRDHGGARFSRGRLFLIFFRANANAVHYANTVLSTKLVGLAVGATGVVAPLAINQQPVL